MSRLVCRAPRRDEQSVHLRSLGDEEREGLRAVHAVFGPQLGGERGVGHAEAGGGRRGPQSRGGGEWKAMLLAVTSRSRRVLQQTGGQKQGAEQAAGGK